MGEKSLLDSGWVIICSWLVFLMQAGFLCVESGLTSTKNSINAAIKNLADIGVSIVLFWAFGYGLMFGDSWCGIFGTNGFMPEVSQGPLWHSAFFLYMVMFCSTAVTILSGAASERLRFISYMTIIPFITCLIYPVFGHWAWNGMLNGQHDGWLGARGFVDFAGSTVVHSLGGWVSLAALIVIGSRKGRFKGSNHTSSHPGLTTGSNLPMVILGVLLLWLGFFGFNGGSALQLNHLVPRIINNTLLAGAGGLVACLGFGWIIRLKASVDLVIIGSLGGLVSICAGSHAFNAIQSLFIGATGGCVALILNFLLIKNNIDDAVHAVPIHLGGGLWGTLAVGTFGDPAILGTGLSQGQQMIIQIVGILMCFAWAFGLTLIILWGINRIIPLRVSSDDEDIGLNVSEHGAGTEILGLFRTMEQQARTGDLNLRVPVEPHTEIGQIAMRYNQVMDSLQGALDQNRQLSLAREKLQDQSADLANQKQLLEKAMADRILAERENEKIAAEASKIARLASIGELAAGVAHEINNPLNGIINYAQLITDGIQDRLRQNQLLGEIMYEGQRIASIVRNLLSFSRQGEEKIEASDPSKILDDALQLLGNPLRRDGIVLDIYQPEPPFTILCRRGEIQQVFINLLSNSRYALNKKFPSPHADKKLSVDLRPSGTPDQPAVSIRFKDHGIGIPADILDRLCDPFFTTKPKGEGTGLGLSICFGIIEKHQGQMKFESTEGEYTQVELILPAGEVTA